MSDQELTKDEEQPDETQMQDLDVEEEQQDDVTGGAMKRGQDDRRM